MKYYFFLDETGDHGLNFIDENFPLFLLCGCLFREDHLTAMHEKIVLFKDNYFNTSKVVLHSRDIRRCEGAFQILFDLVLKARFYTDINTILSQTEYTIIGAGINKEEHVKCYGRGAKDPYSLSLSFIIERLVFYLDKVDSLATVEIMVEKRGAKEDRMLLAHFNATMDKGTFYVSPERLKKRITRFDFKAKRDNIIGLQVADLCAYPLARNILHPEEPYCPFDIIRNKIYAKDKGEYMGWGLKVFP